MKKAFLAAVLGMCIFGTSVMGADCTYSSAQSASLYLYDANMCGTDVNEKSQESWRGDCHTCDSSVPLDTSHTDLSQSFIDSNRAVLDPDGDGLIDLSGGYHDAGDHVKFGLPQMYTAVTLQWALYEFKDSFEHNGDMAHFRTVLDRFTSYIKKCTFLNTDGEVVAFCHMVGEGNSDHSYWGAPESQTTARPSYFATAQTPATDITSLAAAALAADYANTGDSESLKYAKALYSFTYNSPNKAVGDDRGTFYDSQNYNDDLAYAAAWLYTATNDSTYLSQAEGLMGNAVYDVPYWVYCWDNTWSGSVMLLGEKTGNNAYLSSIEQMLNNWQNNYNTPQGYACINEWGSARYNANAQFIALIYAKHTGKTAYAEWAKKQMDYLLGNNNANTCYVTGLCSNSVKYPHHRAASGLSDANDSSPHKYTLRGALVGGPDKNDYHIDSTGNYQYSEVAIDYNAGFVGACAGLYALYEDKGDTSSTTTTETTTETTTVTVTETTTETTTVTENTTETTTENPDTVLMGDVNLSGTVTAEDAAYLLQKTLQNAFKMGCENKYPDNYIPLIADVTGDGILSSGDSAAIIQKSLDNSFVFEALIK